MGALWSRLTRRGAESTSSAVPDDGETAAATSGMFTFSRPRFTAPAKFGAWLARPMTSFHLMISVAGLLTTLGLIMVLSASGVHSYDEDGSPWSIFFRQLMWAAVGLFTCWFALRLRVGFMRRTAFAAFAGTIVMLVLVLIPGIGHVSNGTRGWFVVAGLSMQPSELAKIAFMIWGSHLLAARRMERASLREMLIPLIPAAVLALALIVIQPDLGQTVSLGIILLALLWFAGMPLKVFLASLGATVFAGAILAVSEGYRSDRVRSWLDPSADVQGAGYQARQAKFALANGGVFGDGLGQGTAKWNYLPNAHNDFIFAIIGEELGFIGAFGLLCLFGLFAYTGMRIARRSADPFLRLLTATATAWVVGQVFINVGYVIGLLPVTGIQLPLISAGGTSTATTLFMIGLMANAARHEPDAVAALRAGRDDKMNRLLRLPLPEPYLPSRVEVLRDRLRTRGAAGETSTVKGARPAKPAKSVKPAKSAKPAKSVKQSKQPKARPKAAAAASARVSARKAGAGTAHADPRRAGHPAAAARRSGHDGDASQQRRGAAAQGRPRRPAHEHRGRRSRALEGQRYG